MILTCERCSARYAIDETRLGGAGRKVRCTACGHVWHFSPPPGDPAPEPAMPDFAPVFSSVEDEIAPGPAAASHAEEPAPVMMRARPRFLDAAEEKKPRFAALRKLVRMAVPGLMLIVAALLFRDSLVRAWPPATRLFAEIGLPAPATEPGLVIRRVTLKRVGDSGPVTVEGELINTGDRARDVAALHASLMADDKVVARWSFQPKERALEPGQVSSFRTEFSDAPPEAKSVTVGLWR